METLTSSLKTRLNLPENVYCSFRLVKEQGIQTLVIDAANTYDEIQISLRGVEIRRWCQKAEIQVFRVVCKGMQVVKCSVL